MSDVAPEGQTAQDASAPQSLTDPTLETPGVPLMRYTLHIPVHDKDLNEIPHVLGAVRTAMTQAGLTGRIVVRRAQGDFADGDTRELDLVMVDAPNDPQTQQTILTIAQGASQLTHQSHINVTAQPISYLM